MNVYHAYNFEVKAVRRRFMEPNLWDTTQHCIIADDYDEARVHLERTMTEAGWDIQEMQCSEFPIFDIRKEDK